jgi:hypothetical protein
VRAGRVAGDRPLTYGVRDSTANKTNIERTRVLLPRVEVLAVGTYSAGNGGGATGTRDGSLMLTEAVVQADAERLIEGLSHGTLYLGLSPTRSTYGAAGAWTTPTVATAAGRCSSEDLR